MSSSARRFRNMECGFCRALRQSPWWYRLWLRVAYGIKVEHP